MRLRIRLLPLLFAASLLFWAFLNDVLYRCALAEVDALWDAHLEASAHLVLAFVRASAKTGTLDDLKQRISQLVPTSLPVPHDFDRRLPSDKSHPQRSLELQLLGADGSLLFRSPRAPAEPLARGVGGYSRRVIDGTDWRALAVADPGTGLVLCAGEEYAPRKALALHLARHLALPSLLAIPPVLVLIWLAMTAGLRSVSRLVREVQDLSPADLRPLLRPERAPTGLSPLIDALNALIERTTAAMESERRFTAHAAHELRNPLTAVRVQLQVAEGAVSAAQLQRALSQTRAGTDKALRLIDRLLALARLDSGEMTLKRVPVSLGTLVAEVAADLEPLARQQELVLDVAADAAAVSPGDPTYLSILVRNLIENAIRYSGPGGIVTVRVRCRVGLNRLVVQDRGPGIAEDEHEEVYRPFWRGRDARGPGTGLGLSLVRRICELHAGQVRLRNQETGGLSCEVDLPALAVRSCRKTSNVDLWEPKPRSLSAQLENGQD